KKKHIINKKRLFTFLALVILAGCLAVGGFVISIIRETPDIDPGSIYSLLSENSVLYDDEGNVIDSVLTSNKELRTNISYSDLPQDLIDAFVAIEDKTFWEHHGFNVVRILGAIKEGVLEGQNISGTSTITQQLARNLFLPDTKSDYDMKRKIQEAYYAVLLEENLTKEQILEAYLNTISLGFGANGVQAASQAYFSKDVQDLTLLECATLASIPKAPGQLAPVKRYETAQVTPDDPNIIRKGDTYTLVYNDSVIDRKNLVLSFMLEQGLITQAEHDAAKAANLKEALNPSQSATDEISGYFADYAIDQVVKDLMAAFDLDEEQARQRINNSGLKIYTTLNSGMQKIAEEEFTKNENFPKVYNLKKDKAKNILGTTGNILLYSYSNYFDENGTFLLSPDEYQAASDGGIVLLKGKRLNFYKTEVQGQVDYSVEFKDMYTDEDGIFYCIKGGVIKIPQQYKSRDDDGNLVISGQFFTDQPDFFQFVPEGAALGGKTYTLKQKVIQPQSAMVIFDYHTGGIKAMVGGRNIEGRLLFNRATSPRQPGSSIKPMGVYGPALQSGLDKANSGVVNVASEGNNSYGALWTAASVIDDAPLTIQGKVWPKNWYAGYKGLHTMRRSLEQSVNVNAVKIFSDIGIQNSLSFLKKCGITSIVETGSVNDMNAAALALGGMTHGISPLEMAAGYGTFAAQGNYTEPIAYTKVTNKRGEVILEKTAEQTRIMDEGVAFIMQDMLRSVVTSGIGGAAAIGTQPVAGKTGTTTDNFDAWFVGFTPQYAASLWIGNDMSVELSQGSASAARLWSKIMKRVHEGLDTGSFPTAPSDVISVAIDTMSGRLPSELSALDPRGSTVRNEYFIRGTEPTTTDNVHVAVDICQESNYLATPYCPNVISKVFVKRPYTADPSVGDIAYEQPSYYCNLHNPNPSVYPIDPNAVYNPGNEGDGTWDGSEGNPDGGGIIPVVPSNPDGGNDGQDDGIELPDWFN
ncbi:MAG TPA: transglycosylase domain-containing protein, partial [Anaerovoracaceae bacterium]|nr:transglycosylase domain-containing protein [Anaerovoracaceae bacterium]